MVQIVGQIVELRTPMRLNGFINGMPLIHVELKRSGLGRLSSLR